MINYQKKKLTKLIFLILTQVFLLTSVVYPESSSNKNTSSVYIYDRDLRVPLDSSNKYNRMQEALNAEGGRRSIFKKIGRGEFYDAYGNGAHPGSPSTSPFDRLKTTLSLSNQSPGFLGRNTEMDSIERMIKESGREGLKEKLPYIEKWYHYVRQSYEKDGHIEKGYHRFAHSMETTQLNLESDLNSGEEFTDQMLFESVLAGIGHDVVPGRAKDDFPKVPDTIEFIEKLDEIKQREIFGASWNDMGADKLHIFALIRRTDYGDKPEDAERIEKVYGETLEKIDDKEIRKKINKLAIMLHDADLLATYLFLKSEKSEERVRDLAHEKHLDADSMVSGTSDFIKYVVMPAFKRLPEVLQNKYQAQLDAVKGHFENARAEAEKVKEITNVILESLVNIDIENLRDPNKLCGWIAYYNFLLERFDPYKVLEVILEKTGQSQYIDVYKEVLKIKISNAEEKQKKGLRMSSFEYLAEDWETINTEGSEDLIDSLRPFDEKRAIKLSDVELGSLGHGVGHTTYEGELDDLREAVNIVNDYVKEGRMMGSEKIPSPFRAHGAEIQAGESKNISLGKYKFIIDVFEDRIIIKSTEEDDWEFYKAIKVLIKKSEPRGMDIIKKPSGILKIDGKEYSFYTKDKSIILKPLHEIMRIHRSVARNLMVYTEFGQIIKAKAGEYRIPYDAFRDLLNYTSPDKTTELMDRYFEWLKTEEIKIERNMSGALHPVELAAQAFCRLMWIHPFENGNTRTASLVMNYILMKNNYPPIVLTESNQGEFFKVLRFMHVPFKLDVLNGKLISTIDSAKIFSFVPKDFTAFLASQIKQMSIPVTGLEATIDEPRSRGTLSTGVNGQFLKENKGWQSRPEYAKWLYDVKNKIMELRGDAIDVKAYYYAIGGGFSSPDSGAEDIDIVSPLIATDFTQLIGADVTQVDFEIFKRRIKKDLSSLQGIDLDGISFGRGVENIGGISYPVLTTNFYYLGKSREVKVYYNLDATQVYPDELKNGYSILYSRGNPGLIRKMSKAVKSGLVNNLFKNNSFIVMENLPNSDLSFDGFDKVSLGNVSWAGVRKLDFYTNISRNVANKRTMQGIVTTANNTRKDL